MSQIMENDKEYIANTYARFPVVLKSGKGSVCTDEDGNSWYEWVDHQGDINDPAGGTTAAGTTNLEPGTYRVYGVAEGPGYESRESETVTLTVTDPAMPENNILFNVSKTEIQTGEEYQVSAYAPGSYWIEFFKDYPDNDWWKDDCWDESFSWSRRDY